MIEKVRLDAALLRLSPARHFYLPVPPEIHHWFEVLFGLLLKIKN